MITNDDDVVGVAYNSKQLRQGSVRAGGLRPAKQTVLRRHFDVEAVVGLRPCDERVVERDDLQLAGMLRIFLP